ncbi:CD48 antigen-like [Hyla sarda]|uniref:CD48 antigen-like n=1 Tax=Hyla sarda TaxID=327740 RepID=UPI0024C43F23|nr:CD48 antigen-like [Hyla sarda]
MYLDIVDYRLNMGLYEAAMLGRIIYTLTILMAPKPIISEGKPDVPLPVHGIINQSADLSLPVDQIGSELEIYWNYQTYILTHFTNNQLKNTDDNYKNRLETLNNGATLRINNLRKEDGGIYYATVYITDKKEYESYNLTVYDPVPSPEIRIEVKENTKERCNVTLRCSVPSNTSDLSYTWKYRHQDPKYHLYNNGSVIQISVNFDSVDMEILCIVQNPADQKNVSYTVRHICHDLVPVSQSKDGRRYYYYMSVIMVILVLVSVMLVFFLNIKRKKAEKESKQESEIQYAELSLVSQSWKNQRDEPKEEEQSTAIEYSTLVHQPTRT